MVVKEIINLIKNMALGVIISLLIIRFIGTSAMVFQESMQPTLIQNDILWVEKITPTFGNLKRGDIVTIYAPDIITTESNSLVKRVVAIENDHVLIKDGKVYINGSEIKEDYIKGTYTQPPTNPKHNNLIISPGHIYVLGDNRSIPIHDSRDMGQIANENVTGRIIFLIVSIQKIGSLIKG